MNDVPVDRIHLSAAATTALGVVLVVYLAVLTVLSLLAGKKVETEDDYLVAGRKLSLFFCWATMVATWFGAEAMTASSENARREGLLGVVLDPFASAATFILAGLFFAAPLRRMKLTTTSDFFRRTYGNTSEALSGWIQVPSYFGWIALQYQALADLQENYFGIPHQQGIAIAWFVTLAFTMIGGMWSVTFTESLQIFIALSGLVILAGATFWQFGEGSVFAGLDRLFLESDPGVLTLVPPAAMAGLLAYFGAWANGMLGNVPGQDLQQRVFSARDEKTAVQACLLTGVTYFCFGMLPVSLGLASRIIVPDVPEQGILWVMVNLFLSPAFAVFFILAFTSMVISTTTSAILAPAAILSHSLLGRWTIFQNRGLNLDRASVFLISLGGLSLTFLDRSKMELLSLSMAITLVALFVPMWLGLYGRPRSELTAILAMVLGLGCFMIRWLPENVLAPMPDGVIVVTANGTRMVEYHNYVAYERVDGFTFPRMKHQDPADAEPELTDVPRLSAKAGLVRDLFVVPATLYGLVASLIGYLLGQAIHFRRTPINDETLKEAWGERWTRFT